MIIKQLAVACATALATALLVVAPAGTGSAAAAGYTHCEYGDYKAKNKLISGNKKVAVTHLDTYPAAPGYSKTKTVKLEKRTVLRGSVKLSAEVSATLGNKIIKLGEAKVGLALRAAGSRTNNKTVKVTETIKNTSKKNATFVFFRGNKHARGDWKRSYCKQLTGKIGEVKWSKGKWGSFDSMDDGAVRCGAGTKNLNSVAKRAYRIGCS